MKQMPPRHNRDELNIAQFARILQRRWKTVAVAAVAGLVFALVFHLVYPRKYESTAQLLVMRKDPRLAAKGVESGAESEVRVTEELLATHMQLLQSKTVVDGALKKEGLADLPSIAAHLAPGEKSSDNVIKKMRVTRGGKGQARTAHVLDVFFPSSSKEDSKAILKAIIHNYQSFLAAKFQDVNQEAASLLTQAKTDLAAELETAEKAYEEFRQKSSSLVWKTGGIESTNVHRVRFEAILQEVTNLKLTRAEAVAKLDSINELLDSRNPNELTDFDRLSLIDEKNLTRVSLLLAVRKGEADSPQFQAEQPNRLALARAEIETFNSMQMTLKRLLAELGPNHPEVVSVRSQIESTSNFLEKHKLGLKSGDGPASIDAVAFLNGYRQLLKNDIAAMDRREQSLNKFAEETIDLASQMVADEIQVDTLRREVQRKQSLFDAAVDRLSDINLARDYGGFINEILAEPETGLQVFPKLKISLVLGLLLYICIGVSGVVIAEFRDRRYRSLTNLQDNLQLPILGRIPSMHTPAEEIGSFFKRRSASEFSERSRIVDSQSSASNAFRLLRNSSIFAQGANSHQIVCITSSDPADRASSITANLAVSIGQLGRRVLIIDCNLRMPTQHEIFSISNERGLTTLLSSDSDCSDFIQSTAYKNVDAIPCGSSVPDSAEILARAEFARLLDSLREKYDLILLDCPPVLTGADALGPAATADGVLFVIQVERTSQLHAEAACTILRQAGAELLGIIVSGSVSGSMDDETYCLSYEYKNPQFENSTANHAIKTEIDSAHGVSLNGSRIASTFRNGRHKTNTN